MTGRIANFWKLLQTFRARARRAGRPLSTVMREVLAVMKGPGRLSPSEYLDYALERADMPLSRKLEFVGYRGQHVIDEIATDDYSKIVSLDKLTFDALMRGRGFPVPELHGVFDPTGHRRLPDVPLAKDAYELGALLERLQPRKLYMKATFGAYGRTNQWVQSFDSETRQVVTKAGIRLPIAEFSQSFANGALPGAMIQEALEPHAAIVDVCGSRLSGLRVQVLLTRKGPKVFRCTWKITTGGNVVDNFQHGASGNFLGAVDLSTGRVIRVIAGVGERQVLNPLHPDTGAILVGFQIPDWHRLCALVEAASLTVPGFLVQGWDVALTPRGPVLMEVNWVGDVDLPQHAYGRGWCDEVFLGFLAERSLDRLLAGNDYDRVVNRATGRRGRRRAHWNY